MVRLKNMLHNIYKFSWQTSQTKGHYNKLITPIFGGETSFG